MAYWRNPVLQTAIRTKVPLETTSQLKSSLPQPSTGWKLCQLQGNDFMLQYDIHLQYSDTHIDESARLIACVYIFPFGLPKHLYFPDHWKSAHFLNSFRLMYRLLLNGVSTCVALLLTHTNFVRNLPRASWSETELRVSFTKN